MLEHNWIRKSIKMSIIIWLILQAIPKSIIVKFKGIIDSSLTITLQHCNTSA